MIFSYADDQNLSFVAAIRQSLTCCVRPGRPLIGDPFSADTEQGPQVDQDQFNKVMSYIDAGKREGASLLCGGSRVGDRGYFVAPTVFADVQDNMKIAQEEIFGPVMSLIPFDSLAEREKAWAAFGGDPEWTKVRTESIAKNGQVSSIIQMSLFKATPYSPVQ